MQISRESLLGCQKEPPEGQVSDDGERTYSVIDGRVEED